jgi:glycosyltransferase involved in cell wall biosynthesis
VNGRALRTCFLADGDIQGGVATSLRTLVQACQTAGIEACFIWTGTGCTQREYAAQGFPSAVVDLGRVPLMSRVTTSGKRLSIRAAAWWVERMLRHAVPVGRQLRTWRADVLYSNQFFHHLLGGLGARLAGAACIWHVRNTMSGRLAGGLALRLYSLMAYLLASRVICVSRAVAEQLASVPRPRLRVLYNALPDLPPPPAGTITGWRQDMGADADTVVVGLVTRINPNKGIEVFIRAAERIRNRHGNVRFIVVGGPANDQEEHLFLRYQAYCRERNVNDVVRFLGFRRDARSLYFAMDVVCSCSLATEGLNNTIIEAMAAGRPTVVSRCGGQPELVEDGRTGTVYPAGDAARLAEALEPWIASPQKRATAGALARRRYLERFEAGRLPAELSDILHRSVHRRRRPAGWTHRKPRRAATPSEPCAAPHRGLPY